jgi:hypothetical protein
MKRSEALIVIAKVLYRQAKSLDDDGYLTNGLSDFESSKVAWIKDADEILSALEDKGMAPPERRGSHTGQTYSTWESEDEKK